MSTFFLLSEDKNMVVGAQFAGYVVFYRKSNNISDMEVQNSLFSKLIENALKLKLEQFLFVDLNAKTQRFSVINKAVEVRKCFLFGVSEREVGLNMDIPLYQLMNVSNIEFLRADAPEVLENDKHKKSQLWQQLQLAFKLTV